MPKSVYILAIENLSSATRCRDIRYECEAFGTVLDVRFFFSSPRLPSRRAACLRAPSPHPSSPPFLSLSQVERDMSERLALVEFKQ